MIVEHLQERAQDKVFLWIVYLESSTPIWMLTSIQELLWTSVLEVWKKFELAASWTSRSRVSCDFRRVRDDAKDFSRISDTRTASFFVKFPWTSSSMKIPKELSSFTKSFIASKVKQSRAEIVSCLLQNWEAKCICSMIISLSVSSIIWRLGRTLDR